MLHLFFQYIALFVVEEIVRGEKVLPGMDISDTVALSIPIPFNQSLFDRAYIVYARLLKGRPLGFRMWVLGHIAHPHYLMSFRSACCETYEASLQYEAYHESWASYYC